MLDKHGGRPHRLAISRALGRRIAHLFVTRFPTMKSIFVTSLFSAVVSLAELFTFSVMSFVPGRAVEKERAVMMTVTGLFAGALGTATPQSAA